MKNDDKGCAPIFRSICDDSCEVEADLAIGEVNNNDTKISQNETQTIQDATKILFERINPSEIAAITSKQKTFKQIK